VEVVIAEEEEEGIAVAEEGITVVVAATVVAATRVATRAVTNRVGMEEVATNKASEVCFVLNLVVVVGSDFTCTRIPSRISGLSVASRF
jgi:hypothetical protein